MNLKGELIVTLPKYGDEFDIEAFLQDKAGWILKHQRRMENMQKKIRLPNTREMYIEQKDLFLKEIQKRINFFNSLYGFSYGKVRIGNQTSVWGSCTRAGNLQFNIKLRYLPKAAIDYVVVHELCHLKEHNHGPRFWALVEKTVPNHKKLRGVLREYIIG